MTYAATILAQNPRHYWRLQETTGTNGNDEGTGNADLVLGTTTKGEPGAYAGSTSHYISGAGAAHSGTISLSSAAYTLSGLVKLDAAFPTTFHETLVGMAQDGTQRTRWYLRRNATGNRVAYWDNTNTFKESTAAALSGSPTWHHVALVVNGTNAKICIDAVESGSITIAAPGDTYTTISVGAASAAGDPLKGWMQDVAVWGSALSGAQIAAQVAALTAVEVGGGTWSLIDGGVEVPLSIELVGP